MSDRDPRVTLGEMREHILHIRDFVSHGMTEETFAKDAKTYHATVRCLEIISEAARRLPEDARARYPTLPWRNIMDAGNLYRHAYHALPPSIVWETAMVSILPLLEMIDLELSNKP